MIKPQRCAAFALMLILASHLPQAGAQQNKIYESDIEEAYTFTVSITTSAGYLSVANKRNCLMINSQDIASLERCPMAQQAEPTVSTFTLIELKANRCLADNGHGPELMTCDIADTAQQWNTLPGIASEVKNSKTSHCLTATGLGQPVKLEKCTGISAQNWTLP